MKTTTIFIASGALLIGLSASLNLYKSGQPETVVTEKPSIESPREVSRSLLLPVKDTHTSVLLPGELMATFTDSTKEQIQPESDGKEEEVLEEIVYIETDEKVDLGFDVNEYLPADFKAVPKGEVPLTEIEYLEPENTTDLGFDPSNYLPEDFNPYTTKVTGPQDIPYMEETTAIELGFDVNEFLPATFDPYVPVAKSPVSAWATSPLSVCILTE